MHLQLTGVKVDKTHSHTDKNGHPVDEVVLDESLYDRIVVLRFETRDGEFKYKCDCFKDGDKKQFTFSRSPYQFTGVQAETGRDSLPSDVEDVMLRLGMAPVPELEFFVESE